MTPTVVNVKHAECDVYVGRAGYGRPASKWANPYPITPAYTRRRVIKLYRKHVLGRPDLMASLGELTGKVLGCWCRPLPCHADVLVELWKESIHGS